MPISLSELDISNGYDLTVIGNGPTGAALACSLKAINPKLRICTLDQRLETGRKHGLIIQKESISKLIKILNKELKVATSEQDTTQIKELKQEFESWKKKRFMRTNEIEERLTALAEKMNIAVVRDKLCKITPDNLDELLEGDLEVDEEEGVNEEQNKLKQIFQQSRLIIGADGAHSAIREKVMKDKLVGEKTYQYVVELKYQTDGRTKPRGWFSAIFKPFGGFVDFESMSRRRQEEQKPATLHIFVDKETYEEFRETDENGEVIGNFKNPWSFDAIEAKAADNEKVRRVFRNIKTNLNRVTNQNRKFDDVKISTLKLEVYQSKKSVKNYKDKNFLIIGDANSGLILQEGYNKALEETAACVQAVTTYFQNNVGKEDKSKAPSSLKKYQTQARQIYKRKITKIKRKNFAIRFSKTVVNVANAVKIK